MTTIYLGIDPGKAGAIAVLDETGGVEKVIGMPVVKAAAGKGSRTEYDVPAIRDFFEGWLKVGQLFVTVEKSVPMPGTFERKRPKKEEEGEEMPDDAGPPPMSRGASIANYHRGGARYGWEFFLIALRIPHQFEVPQAWQNVMLAGTAGRDTKQRSILAAHRLFPAVTLRRNERSRGLDHNLSDALLIAEFGRRMRTGVLEIPGRRKVPPLPLFG